MVKGVAWEHAMYEHHEQCFHAQILKKTEK